jgi:uncharacterized protein YjiS (DUF1127 family)
MTEREHADMVAALKIAARHYRRRARRCEDLAERLSNNVLNDEGRRDPAQLQED